GDDPGRGDGAAVPRPDGEEDTAGLSGGGSLEGKGSAVVAFAPQACDIGGRIASDNGRRDAVAARDLDPDLALLREGLVGGDDETGLVGDPRRSRAAGVYGDNVGRRGRDDVREGLGKDLQG